MFTTRTNLEAIDYEKSTSERVSVVLHEMSSIDAMITTRRGKMLD